MPRKVLTTLAAALAVCLSAAEPLLTVDILECAPRIQVTKGGSMTPLETGGYRFELSPQAHDCWVHIPVEIEDLKVFDELEFVVSTREPKAAGVFELYASSPSEKSMVMKKNFWLKPGQTCYRWTNRHAGMWIPPTMLSIRLTSQFDNYHLPQSEIHGPVDFLSIRFVATAEGLARLRRQLEEQFDTSRYQELGSSARVAAERRRDLLARQYEALVAVTEAPETSQDKRQDALARLYDLRNSAGWEIEAAALEACESAVVVGTTGGADKVYRNRRFPGKFFAPARISLARREYESAQIALFPRQEVGEVSVHWTELVNQAGDILSQDLLSVAPVGYVKPQPAAYVTEFSGMWIPDPILTESRQLVLEKDAYQTFWVDVHVPSGQPPGLYRGQVEFRAGRQVIATVPLEIQVWDFCLPEKLSLPCVISADFLGGNSNFPRVYCDDVLAVDQWSRYMDAEHPEDIELSSEARRLVDISMQTMRLYREHHIPFSDIYRGVTKVHPAWKRRMILEDDGLFCLGYDKGKDKFDALGPEIEAMRQEGTARRAYIYGYDEITSLKAFQSMKRSYAEIKEKFPEVLRSAVALDYTFGELTDTTETLDIWIIPPTEYIEALPAIARARQRGKQVWWYPCNWPFPPDANLLLESDATATRLIIGFMPWKYQVDGFLYYSSTFWIASRPTDNWLGAFTTSGGAALARYGTFDGDHEYAVVTTPISRKAGLKQTATLKQLDTDAIKAEMDIEVEELADGTSNRLEVEIHLNYQDGRRQQLKFPLDGHAGRNIRFSETIQPEEPVKSVFFALWVENDQARLVCRHVALRQPGKMRKVRQRLSSPLVGGPLFEKCFLDVFASNGDGSLFYPGQMGTLPSLRAKLLRDGREDYEYLTMLKAAVAEMEACGLDTMAENRDWLEAARMALGVDVQVCSGLDEYSREGEHLLSYRERIGKLLEQWHRKLCEPSQPYSNEEK